MRCSTLTLRFAAALLLAGLVCSLCPAETPTAPQPAPIRKKGAAGLKFRVQKLYEDNNEGCAVADFNHDGKLDISAGEFWYPGPDFKERKPLRKLEPFGKDYLPNN